MERDPQRLDLSSFATRRDPIQIGDITYMPPYPESWEWAGATQALYAHLDDLPIAIAEELRASPPNIAQLVIQRFAHDAAEINPHHLPEWFTSLPDPFQRDAACTWVTFHIENPNILPSCPHMGLGGYAGNLEQTTMIGQAFTAYRLMRLSGIRQLAWLTTPIFPKERQAYVIPMRYDHTRLIHVWDVTAIANLLAHAHRLPDEEKRLLILAALTHDARTPAGGDSTKLLDRVFFDEDLNYHTLLDDPEITELLATWNISRDQLIHTVNGKGLLGSLLDIADKTAYVSRDARYFCERFRNDDFDCREADWIKDLMRDHPFDACTAWQYTEIRDGRIVFTDPIRLARFLMLRACLFRAVYWHPGSRFSELILGNTILRYLIASGTIRKEQLLEWTDAELDQAIQRFSHTAYGLKYGEPNHEGFCTEDAMRCRAQELKRDNEVCVTTEILPPRISSGTKFLVTRGARVGSLSELYPDLARPIEVMAETIEPFRLYWVPWDTMPKHLCDAIRALAR